MKTLWIGLDAGCWEYLDPLLEAGCLPNINGLIKSGIHGTLRSTMPPITPTAWSSLVTGVNPGKHGIFEWVRRSPISYRSIPVNAEDRIGTPVWTRLNAAGIRVGVVNIPLTYPVQPLDGFLLCGFSTPSSAFDLAYPQKLLAEIESEYGQYQPVVQIKPNNSTHQVLYTAEREHQKRLLHITTTQAQRQEVEVLILNLMLLDHANHLMPTKEMVNRAIVDCDADVGYLLQEFAPDNVIMISDHGSRRVKGVFLLSAWLADHGYQTRRPRPLTQRKEVINYVLMKLMNGDNGNVSRINRFVLRESLVRLPAKISASVWRNIEKELPLALMQVETIDDFVPPHTRVYIHGGNRGNLNINLRGREPQGIVTEPEQEHLLAQLTDDLLSIRDPDNELSIFSEVYESKDLYEGPLSCFAPDLVGDYYLSDWSMRVNLPGLHRRPSRYFLTEEAWYGDHSRDGIFIFTGSDFGRSNERGLANLLDIPATLLYLYDVPLPSDYDGKPLVDSIFSGHPVRYQPGDNRILEEKNYVYSSDEEREVLERLSELGYLD